MRNIKKAVSTAIAMVAMMMPAPASATKFDDVAQIAPDTYQISRMDHAGIFGNTGKMKTAVLKHAQEFAESQGKVAVAISIKETPNASFRFAQIEYTFLVVDKADADARHVRLTKEPDRVTEQRVKIDVNQGQPEQKPDVYAELLKLDDLRKRGIITEVEFEQQKKKLLSK